MDPQPLATSTILHSTGGRLGSPLYPTKVIRQHPRQQQRQHLLQQQPRQQLWRQGVISPTRLYRSRTAHSPAFERWPELGRDR